MRLSVGCGRTWAEGFEGLDSVYFGQKYIVNLEDNPLVIPIDDNTVEEADMFNTIEHLTRPAALRALNELHRIMKAGAILTIITPDAEKSIALALQDPTHVSMWIKGTFTQYICGGRPRNADYGIKKWELIECRNYEEKEPRDMIIRMTPRK